MPNAVRSTLAVVVIASLAACAGGGGTPATTTPSAPVDLAGTKWKLVILGGKLDGRIVEFKMEGGAYVATLVEPGLRLRDVPGVRAGMRVFVLEKSPSNPNEYTGTFETMDSQGTPLTKQVSVTVTAEGLSWTLESAIWERA